ncbi:unnamed protein product [Phaedon cochleariae]|uniref:PLAT domain-containing protein n=1 Tax=Phaedon cochleariae TaxID=80249 RepID=A0A9P0DJI3_PHACE|nr:unnamed protein product [Phaedon cochleariae]
MTNDNFLWTVNDDEFDYDSGANEFGRNMNIFIINENALKAGKSYHVEVVFTGQLTSKASTWLMTHQGPELLSVKISPNVGDALRTKFILACEPGNGPYVFEIYALSEKSEFLLQKGGRCSEMPLYLSSEIKKVKVKMIDEYQYFDSKTVDVTVNPVLGPVTSEKELELEIKKQYFDSSSPDSISNLIESQNYDQLLQVLNVFCDDLEKISETVDGADTVKKYQIEILNILGEAPMLSRERTKQAASIARKIAKSVELKSDPDIARSASKVCEEAAAKNLELLQEEKYPKSLEEDILEDSKMYAECSQSGTAPNMEILEVNDTISEPPTPFPVMDIPAIVEDYPDYVDDQNISQILSKYEESSESLVELCYLNSKTLALSVSVKDVRKSVAYQNFEVTATKAYGVNVPDITVSSQNVELFASGDFVKFGKKEVEILLCTSTKNPFWWIKKQPTITSVAILQFQAEQKIIDKFNDPVSIIFENCDTNQTLIYHNSTTPRLVNTNSNNKESEDLEKFVIFRLDVLKKRGYFIEFQDLAEGVCLDTAESSSKEKIHCLCYHSSILTGRIMNNVVREEEDDDFVEHELEIQASYIVFLSVAVVFFIYCVTLTYFSFTSKNNKEHVLNFPDPDKKLLQKNQEDWFFMATENYLGDIEKIELWFDSLGLRPCWYCRDISIIDLQMKKYWYFNVDYLFEISENKENFFCTAYPTKKEQKPMKANLIFEKISMGLQGPHMWNIFE